MTPGLVESARNLLAGVLDLGRTRFELFSTELREELARLAAAIIGGLARAAPRLAQAAPLRCHARRAAARSLGAQAMSSYREELVARSTAQRAAIIAAAQPLLHTATSADRVVSRLRQHPVAVTVAVGAIVLLGSRRLFDLATRAMTLYALFRR